MAQAGLVGDLFAVAGQWWTDPGDKRGVAPAETGLPVIGPAPVPPPLPAATAVPEPTSTPAPTPLPAATAVPTPTVRPLPAATAVPTPTVRPLPAATAVPEPTSMPAPAPLPAATPVPPIVPSAPTITGPGAPTVTSADTLGDTGATINWDPPADDGGSPITSYIVISNPASTNSPLTVGNVDTAEMTGLDHVTIYTFTVSAVNSVGTGPASDPSNAVKTDGAGGPAPWAIALIVLGVVAVIATSGFLYLQRRRRLSQA